MIRPETLDMAQVRAWARDAGHVVPARGRLSKTVIDAYLAADLQPVKDEKSSESNEAELALAQNPAALAATEASLAGTAETAIWDPFADEEPESRPDDETDGLGELDEDDPAVAELEARPMWPDAPDDETDRASGVLAAVISSAVAAKKSTTKPARHAGSIPARGPLPIQLHGDGWGDMPMQMRGGPAE